MQQSCYSRVFSSRYLKYIDEPMIVENKAVFIQKASGGSKITVYDIITDKVKSVTMRDLLCFNAHSYNNNIVFEFSGSRRGIGILCLDTMEIREIDEMESDIVLGGTWENFIVLRQGYDIILFDIIKNVKRTIASYHHIIGAPVIGRGHCAWIQLFKDKCCIVVYDISKKHSLILTLPGYINKVYIVEDYIVYQSCRNNKCGVYLYNIYNGEYKKCFESCSWVELYMGKEGRVVWSVRNEYQGRYLFDIYVYNINSCKMIKSLSDYSSLIIPAVSKNILLWINDSLNEDSVYLTNINI